MVELQHVTVRFGRHTVVNDLSFRIPAGGSLALWGPNGAGKSTTLHAVLGLLPYQGVIRVAGHDAARHGVKARRQIGWVPQEFAPVDMRVGHLVRFLAELRAAAVPSVESVLEPVGLQGTGGLPVAALSGGQRQRLSLALAVLGDPAVLLLDEPTASLDQAGRLQILSWLAGLRRQGKTLLIASHRPEDIGRLADQVAVLEGGRLQRIEPAAASRRRNLRRLRGEEVLACARQR